MILVTWAVLAPYFGMVEVFDYAIATAHLAHIFVVPVFFWVVVEIRRTRRWSTTAAPRLRFVWFGFTHILSAGHARRRAAVAQLGCSASWRRSIRHLKRKVIVQQRVWLRPELDHLAELLGVCDFGAC